MMRSSASTVLATTRCGWVAWGSARAVDVVPATTRDVTGVVALRPSPMTPMSESVRSLVSSVDHNPANCHARTPLARGVHRGVRVVYLALVLAIVSSSGGCVIPPSLSVENQDAGVNSPPAITSIRSDQVELPEPGPVTFARGSGTINLELFDTNIDDRLYVRVFFNYSIANPTAPRAQCTAAPSGSVTRSVTCDIGALCLEEDVENTEYHGMMVHVFDRELAETGTPRFKAMDDEAGLTTSWFYYLDCVQ